MLRATQSDGKPEHAPATDNGTEPRARASGFSKERLLRVFSQSREPATALRALSGPKSERVRPGHHTLSELDPLQSH
jgi:hypothetical protein